MKFKHGDLVKDIVTDYTGVIDAYAHYYGYSSDSYLVKGKDETNTSIYKWIAEDRLKKVNDDDQ